SFPKKTNFSSLWTIYLLTRVFPHGNYCITATRSVRAEVSTGTRRSRVVQGESTRDALIARLARDQSVERPALAAKDLRRLAQRNCLRAVTARWKCDNAVPYILLLARVASLT